MRNTVRHLLSTAALFVASFAGASTPPNIVVILADDLGYGSLGCYGATKIHTPHIDQLAREGMRFTRTHATTSVCTPSRYSLLTGRQLWRSLPEANRRAQWDQWHRVPTMPGDAWLGHVAIEANEPLLIEPGSLTLASLLRDAGYRTACIGKWHLGLGSPKTPGWDDATGPDWNRELTPGPLDVGFDTFFGLPIVNSSEPKIFVEGRRVVGLDPADPIRLVRQPTRFGRLQFVMEGGKRARYAPDRIDERHLARAITWLDEVVSRRQPFFLYLPLSAPHSPFLPAPGFKGSSELGPRGDTLQEMDGRVGELLAALERLGVAHDTLVLFASDNGAQVNSLKRNDRGQSRGHFVNGPLRGSKTEIYEGGTRVPFIARWPGRVPAGTVCDHLVSLADVIATVAELIGRPLPAGAAVDSVSFLAALLQTDAAAGREWLVTASMRGVFALHEGPWKLITSRGHGGHYADEPAEAAVPSAVPGQLDAQLYNIGDDPGETTDLVEKYPDVARRMSDRLATMRHGRPASTSRR